MKSEDLKVGMMVQAIDNYYNYTNKNHKWVGTVYKIYNDGTFVAKTESSTSMAEKDQIYENLRPEHFEEAEPEKVIPLKVTHDYNNIYVIYRGKIVAKATCREDDNFNEEFGLNLALRRFCKTLCDKNITKK